MPYVMPTRRWPTLPPPRVRMVTRRSGRRPVGLGAASWGATKGTPAAEAFMRGQADAFSSWYQPGQGDCKGITSVKATLAATGSKVAGAVGSSLITAAGAAAPSSALVSFAAVAGPAALVIAPVLAVFAAIWGHHAMAVARERNALCVAVPAAREALGAIGAAVRSGLNSPAEGIAALDRLEADFASAVAQIVKSCECYPQAGCRGNAACGMKMGLHYLADQMRAEFSTMPQNALLTSGAGWQGLLPWAAAAGVAYAVLG